MLSVLRGRWQPWLEVGTLLAIKVLVETLVVLNVTLWAMAGPSGYLLEMIIPLLIMLGRGS